MTIMETLYCFSNRFSFFFSGAVFEMKLVEEDEKREKINFPRCDVDKKLLL